MLNQRSHQGKPLPALGALGTGAVVVFVIELVQTSLFSLLALGALIVIATTLDH